MTGIFAQWQPRYAEHRIATFPVRDKRPCIRGWQNVGLPGSAQLAMKFLDVDAFGFQCGAQSRITLIDIDSHDERMVGEAIKLYGESPIIWRTGSGNHAMPFRHNGEARRIRPIPGLPIDVLGGGFAVAPPSMGAKGRYEFLQGSLADLDRLPVARVDKVEPIGAPSPGAALIGQGQRHEALKRALASEIWHADDYASFLDRALTIGTMRCTPPLDASEITDLATWFWQHKEMGLLRRPGHRHWTQDVRDLLLIDRNAGAILQVLRVDHPGERHTFVVANGMAKLLLMNRHNFVAKRKKLEASGLIVLVKPATSTKPALYRWP
jgi:hypothetical protein